MNGFDKRATRIKEKIMKTTLEMLKSWEPKRIRIADISKTANVSQVTIYNYFGSKEALLLEVFKDYMNKTILEFEEFINGEHSLKEKIEYTIFQNKQSYHTFTVPFIKELVLEDDEMKKYIDEQYNGKVVSLMTRLITIGKEKGEISDKVSIPTVLAFIQMFKAQSNELLEMAQQSGNLDEFIEEMVHIFFYGICGRS
jgi:AcrR family transcriptional regulator